MAGGAADVDFAEAELVSKTLIGDAVEARVILRVVTDLVAFRQHAADEPGGLLDPLPDDEESGVNVGFFKNVEEVARRFRMRAIVEGQRQDLLVLRTTLKKAFARFEEAFGGICAGFGDRSMGNLPYARRTDDCKAKPDHDGDEHEERPAHSLRFGLFCP